MQPSPMAVTVGPVRPSRRVSMANSFQTFNPTLTRCGQSWLACRAFGARALIAYASLQSSAAAACRGVPYCDQKWSSKTVEDELAGTAALGFHALVRQLSTAACELTQPG